MDIQATKLELLKTILENENSEFIQRVAEFVKREEKDIWNQLSPSEKLEVEEGIKQLDQGKRVLYDSLIEKISS